MYQTQRSQRVFFSTVRKDVRKTNRAKNIKTIIKTDKKVLDNGYKKNEMLHMAFRKRAIDKARSLKLIN